MFINPSRPNRFRDAVDYIRNPDGLAYIEPLMTSWGTGWEGIDAAIVHNTEIRDPDLQPGVVPSFDGLVFHLDGVVDLSRRFENRVIKEVSHPGGLCIIPRQALMDFHWTNTATVMYVYLTPTLMTNIMEQIGKGDPTHIELIEQFNFRDPFVQQIGNALVSEMQGGGLGGRLYAASLAQALGVHLLRNYASVNRLRPIPEGRLTPAQIRRVTAYIDDHLSHDIGLSELAAQVGFSPSHFARVFKQTTHLAPYQFVIRRRLERAKELLSLPGITVAQVAQQVGFYDQGHLIRHFKRAFGVSPATFRRG